MIVNYYSRFPVIRLLSDMTVSNLCNHFTSVWAEYGLAAMIISDFGQQLSVRSSKQSVNKAELRWRSVLHTITKQTVWLKGRSTVWTYETQGERSPSFPQRMPLHNLVGVPYYSTGRSDAITLRVTIWTQTPNYAAKYQKHLEIQTPARRCSLGSKSARSSKASWVLRKKSWQQQESWTIWNQCL